MGLERKTTLFWVEMTMDGLMWGGKINSTAKHPWVQTLTLVHISCKATSLSLRFSNHFSSNEQRYKSLEACGMFSK